MKTTALKSFSTVPDQETIHWLLSGDPAIIYQTHRDLLKADSQTLAGLQNRIPKEGWGKQFLDKRQKNGLWGGGWYLPKWTSTHYTLLDLKNLGFPKENKAVTESVKGVLNTSLGQDGGYSYDHKFGDVCVNGMILNFGSYFLEKDDRLDEIIEYLLQTIMPDGGWNCKYRLGGSHSSLHSTLSVLEGIDEYMASGNKYRIRDLRQAQNRGVEFLLCHYLFRSHRTGDIIDPKMLLLTYPSRWRYDILRALDYFQKARVSYDPRMKEAIDILLEKRNNDGTWDLQSRHAGKIHFEMEKPGKPSRWNTLRALRVLNWFGQ